MTKRGLLKFFGVLTCCLGLGILLLAVKITRPTQVSPDGLEVSRFELHAGDLTLKSRFTVVFQLKNVSDATITFHPQYGVFVGARSDGRNIDFGHKGMGQTLQPGERITMKAPNQFDQPGEYSFWPAYHTNGHWGPYGWNKITVTIPD
jgi:hypothetical protein